MKVLLDIRILSSCYFMVVMTCHGASMTASRNMEEKKFLRCALISIPPFDTVTYYPNGTSSNQGCSRRNIEWLSAKLGYSIEFIQPTAKHAKERGNEVGLYMVANGEADFVGNALAISAERSRNLDLATFPLLEEPHRMVVPRPGERDRLFAFIKPFTATVWLLLGVSFVVISLFMGFLSWTSARYPFNLNGTGQDNNGAVHHLSKYFLYNVNVLTTHGDYLSETRTSFLLGVSFWLLGASVLVYSYSSIVVSSITVPQMEPSVDTLEDVLHHPEISLIIRTDTYIGSVINSSGVPLYKALREKAKKRPESIGVDGIINPTKLILEGKYAYTFIDTPIRFIVSNLYAKEGKCKYQMSSTLAFWNSQFYLFFAKGNKQLVREFSIGAMYLLETGLLRSCIKSLPLTPKAEQCFSANTGRQTARRMSSIKLVDLTSAFFILGVGAAIALVVFLLEIAFSRRGNESRRSLVTRSTTHKT